MFRSAETDRGFTLVEIIVAIGVLLTVMVALLPQLIVGMRATGTARLVTQAKGVAQGELERMRDLPFYVSTAAGGVDVLDTYYPRRTETSPTPTCATSSGQLNEPQDSSWSGYVSPTATRCSYEPGYDVWRASGRAGAFYRSVRPVVTAPNLGRLVMVTATQFLSSDLPPQPVEPPVGYDSTVADKDVPPTRLIGVSITVLRSDHGRLRPITTYTQIHERGASPQRVRVEATAKAVEVGSVTDEGALSFTAGQLDLRGTLSNAVTSSANLAATTAGLASGVQLSGATGSLTAPPSFSTPADARGDGQLPVVGCSYACWGGTNVGLMTASVDNGLPQAGTPTAPLQAMVTGSGNYGFAVGNTAAGGYVPALNLLGPLVRLDTTVVPVPSGITADCAVGAGSASPYVTASGYLQTTLPGDLTTPYRSESCAVARSTPVSILPTSDSADSPRAIRGVLRIELTSASARCRVDSSGHVANTKYDFRAVVQYWDGSRYVTAATIVPDMTTDPLLAVPLTTAVGGGRVLGDYIASWSSLTKDNVTDTRTTGAAKVNLPGVITLTTQPVRGPSVDLADESSSVSITIGAVACSAEDAR